MRIGTLLMWPLLPQVGEAFRSNEQVVLLIDEIRKHFPYLVWLNREPMPSHPNFWGQTHIQLRKMFPMYRFSAQGLKTAMKRLMVK